MPFNEAIGWIWITLGFLSGALIGLGFHREGFCGGYASFERRLLRLGHIAFFGTGFINIAFALSSARLDLAAPWPTVAGWCLVVGAVAMPVCCAIAARVGPQKQKAMGLFVLPVLSLTTGGVITAIGLTLHVLQSSGGV